MSDPEEQLDDLHEEIIDVLREGRATPSYLSERTGESRQLISQRLRDLRLGGFVEKIHKGLYELADDPFREDSVDTEADTPRTDTTAERSVDPIAEALKGWSYGRGEAEREANHEVAKASLEWLRDDGGDEVKQADVPLDELKAEDREGRQARTLWKNVIKGAWEHAAEQGYVEQPHSRAYRWVGGNDR